MKTHYEAIDRAAARRAIFFSALGQGGEPEEADEDM